MPSWLVITALYEGRYGLDASKTQRNMTENNDPWANLADSLGAAPGGEPSQKPQHRPVKASKPAKADKPANETPAAETSQTDWGGVADQLGIESSSPVSSKPTSERSPRQAEPASQPPQTERPPVDDGFGAGLLDDGGGAPQRSSRPPRRSNVKPRRLSRPARSDDDDRQATPSRNDRSQESSDQTRAQANGQTRDHDRDQVTDESGEPRRRRRGRRGGRGRGRRNDRSTQEEVRADDNEELPGYGRNLNGERTERQGSAVEISSDARPQTRREDGFGQRLDADSEERTAESDAGPRSGGSREDDQEESRTGDRPPRRRRRRRGRGRRIRDGEDVGNESQRSREESGKELNEVTGSHQADEKPFTEREPRGNEESDGEPRRRRRRRRRRTSDEGSQETGGEDRSARSSDSDNSRGQRRPARSGGRRGDARRGSDGEGRRREAFSRVGSRREDDEEGLEFLGTEDEMAPSDRRDNGDEDVLSESGLDGVRDVPSWVEAIGIVIAGNMDSRKQPPQS